MEVASQLVTLIGASIAAVASICVAIIGYLGGKRTQEYARRDEEFQKRQEEYRAKREAQEAEERKVRQEMLNSLICALQCQDVLLIAAKGGHLNGNVDEAIKMNKEARARMRHVATEAMSNTFQ